jgi:hypothetical protein
VRSDVHREAPRKNSAPCLIPKFAVAMIGAAYPVVVKGPDEPVAGSSSGPLYYASREIVLWLTA